MKNRELPTGLAGEGKLTLTRSLSSCFCFVKPGVTWRRRLAVHMCKYENNADMLLCVLTVCDFVRRLRGEPGGTLKSCSCFTTAGLSSHVTFV